MSYIGIDREVTCLICLVLQVYPKTLDTFLLALYASLIPVAYVHIDWLREWLLVLHHGAVACFMWVSFAHLRQPCRMDVSGLSLAT